MTEGTFSSPEDSIPTQSEEDTFSRSEKGPLAFRTISEVADELHVPQHVLRFWETRFEQVRPLKRGGGRRYYRPADIELLRYIADLLYSKGYTVKGVQRLLREGAHTAADVVDVPPTEPTPQPETVPPAAEEAPVLPASAGTDPSEQAEPVSVEVVDAVDGGAIAEEAEAPASVSEPERDETPQDAIGVVETNVDDAVSAEALPALAPELISDESAPPLDVSAVESLEESSAQAQSAGVTEEDVVAAFGAEEPASVEQSDDAVDTTEALPEPDKVSVQGEGHNVVQLKKQNTRLRNDLADILLELQALRSRLSA
ncbi:MerR family transcriptional regulator [Acetobacter tropicalis]|uniref:MerR family transcriptional regulator n=1 Tax=Acetobacter tropicalis TaxID=104102 RepID=UPI0039752DAA